MPSISEAYTPWPRHGVNERTTLSGGMSQSMRRGDLSTDERIERRSMKSERLIPESSSNMLRHDVKDSAASLSFRSEAAHRLRALVSK